MRTYLLLLSVVFTCLQVMAAPGDDRTIQASKLKNGSYVATLPTADGASGECIKTNGVGVWSFAACGGGGGGSGTVTSVAQTVPSFLTISGSPVTVSGTLALGLANQSQNLFFLSPLSGSGVPTFRAPKADDMASGSSNGQFLKTDGSGNLGWQTVSSTSPGGASGQVQFNNAGSFGGDAQLFWDDGNDKLGVRTNTPVGALDVRIDGGSTNGAYFLDGTNNVGVGVESYGTGVLLQGTNATLSGATELAIQIGGGGLKLGPAQLLWPTADGTSGHCLKTNGAGTLSFGACSGGGGGITWATPVDSDIIPDTANTYDLGASANEFKDVWAHSLRSPNTQLYLYGAGSSPTTADILGEAAGTSEAIELSGSSLWLNNGGTQFAIKSKDGTSGPLAIRSGDPAATDDNSGGVSVLSADVTGIGTSGAITLRSGTSEDAASGAMTLVSGATNGTGGSGNVEIKTGISDSAVSGGITLLTGTTATANTFDTGGVFLGSGDSGAGSNTGGITLNTGNLIGGSDDAHGSGTISINSGGTDQGFSGGVNILTGNVAGGAANSGAISLTTGTSAGGITGSISLTPGAGTTPDDTGTITMGGYKTKFNHVINLNPIAGDPTDLSAYEEGDIFYDQTAQVPKFYDGSSWNTFGGGGSYAAQDLSNLTSTAVNLSLVPGGNDTLNLGSSGNIWQSLFGHYIRDSGSNIVMDISGHVLGDSAGSTAINFSNTAKVSVAKPLELYSSASDPTGSSGLIYYNSTATAPKYYNGTSWKSLSPPVPHITVYDSGSGTFTPNSATLWMRVRMVGGGGGGSGTGTGSPGTGSNGGSTTFDALTATGGANGGAYKGGTGGTGSGGNVVNGGGGSGQSVPGNTSPALNQGYGGAGGSSIFGGGGVGGTNGGGAGANGLTNTGSGGSGAGGGGTPGAAGGGAGGYVEHIYTPSSGAVSYAVGSGGGGGAAGGGGGAGGSGAAGKIIIEEYY